MKNQSSLGNRKVMAENIKYYLNKFGKTQREVCDVLGIKETTFSGWIHGRSYPRIDKIEMLANYFGIGKSDLVEQRASTRQGAAAVKIPILGHVVAGVPIEAITDILGYEEITQNMADTGDFFALKIQGHSMEPRLEEGDIVVVRKQSYADSGDIAIILVNGDEATCKQIKKSDTGITLIGFNPVVYPPHFYSKEEIASLPVSIIGIVVESRHTWLKI